MLGTTLIGCNGVLGIEEPIEVAPVKANRTPATTGSSGTGGANSMTASDATSPPADNAAYQWAEWPMPNPPSAGLPNSQNYDTLSFASVVVDLVTGLQWQQLVDEQTYTFTDASAYCQGLTVAGGEWRLPSRIELLSLVDYTNPNPVIDMSAFPNTPPAYFWSSSVFAGDKESAWNVNFQFSDGIADISEMNKLRRVRCVR
jgi:hypothetical protein